MTFLNRFLDYTMLRIASLGMTTHQIVAGVVISRREGSFVLRI